MIPLDKTNIRKILVIRNDNIGDVVCTTPCLEALRNHFPDAYIAILVCRLAEEVVLGNPYIDKVYVYDKAKHGMYTNHLVAWWKQFHVLREIRKERFDIAIGIRSKFSPSQGWLIYSSGATFRLGVAPEKRYKKFSFFYNIYTERRKDAVHEVERSLHVLRKIGVDIAEKRLSLYLLEKNRKDAEKFFSDSGLSRKRPVICVNISSRIEEDRYWDFENYVNFIRKLISNNIQTIITSGPDDVPVVQKILDALNFNIPTYHSKSLKSFAAVVALCNIFVTLEGGPMHISAAVGTPTIAIFNKNNPKIWHPWGVQHRVLQKGDDANLIRPNDVFVAVKELLA